MEFGELVFKILLSLVPGFLLGLEREKKKEDNPYIIGGIRTFTLASLLGGILAYLSELYNSSLILIGFVAVSSLSIIHHFLKYYVHERTGATTNIAYILSFCLGVLIYVSPQIGLLCSIVALFLLSTRIELHKFVKAVNRKELIDFIIFGIVVFLIYPLIPDKEYNFFNLFSLNFRSVWKMVILVSVINAIGYVLIKIFGKKGLVMSGFAGGLISSTAVTLSVSSRVKKKESLVNIGLAAILAAESTRFIRTLVLAGLINILVMKEILPYFAICILLGYLITFYLTRKEHKKEDKIEIKSPFNIQEALFFGFFYGFILAIIEILKKYFGNYGVLIAATINGFADVDAITLSLSQLALPSKGLIDKTVAGLGIALATLTNDVMHSIYASFGSKKLGKLLFLVSVVLIDLSIICYIIFNTFSTL